MIKTACTLSNTTQNAKPKTSKSFEQNFAKHIRPLIINFIHMNKILYSLVLITMFACTQESANLKKNNLILIENNKPTDLFPASIKTTEQSHIVTQIHDGLLALNPTTENIQPLLAKRWFINSNSDRFTFILHDSIFFHNDSCFEHGKGRQVRAYDVKQSLEYTLWHKYYHGNSTGLLQQIKGAREFIENCDSAAYEWNNSLEGITVTDSLQLEIHIDEANPSFLYGLVGADMVILPREAIEKYNNRCMVGCGPFIMNHFGNEKDSVVVTKNPFYYRKDQAGSRLPHLDRVTFTFEARPSVSLQMLREEQAHVLLHIEKQLLPDFMDQNIELFKERNPRLILEQSKGMENTNIYMIKNIRVKNLVYNRMNFLYLDRVFLLENKSIDIHQ